MSNFRGSDETLDREISTVEAIARLRLRRYAKDLRDLDKELRELKKEKARRRAEAEVPASEYTSVGEESGA
jgi:hypothetical protein